MSSSDADEIWFIGSFLLFSIAIGVVIYRLSAGLGWVDSFYNASMILSGAGPIAELVTPCSKILASFYTLYSGIFFVVIIAYVLGRLTTGNIIT
jgi:hypothetical protein